MNSGKACPCEGRSDTWHRVNQIKPCTNAQERKRMRNNASKERTRALTTRPPMGEAEAALIKRLWDVIGKVSLADQYLIRILVCPDVIDATGEYVKEAWKEANSG